MVRLGAAIAAATRGTDAEILAAHAAWTERTGVAPALFPVWRSLTAPGRLGAPSQRLVDGLRAAGSTPVAYLESGHDPAGDGTARYVKLLSGFHDDLLKSFDDPELIVRFDHEMNGKRFPWAKVPPSLYRAAFRHVSEVVTSKLFWCPMGHTAEHLATMADYFPGGWACDYVGFDRYDLGERRPLPKAWAGPIGALRDIVTRPIIVGEFGSLRTPTGDRAPWLRSLSDVRGVWGAIYFDIDMREAEGRDWRLDSGMRRAWREMTP